MTHALELAALLIAQTGDQYVFGAEALADDPDPSAFDCSELIQWGMARFALTFPDGTWIQWRWCRDRDSLVSVEQAKATCGALLFMFSSNPALGGRPSVAHVAMSLGDGRTIEARGTRWGVGSWSSDRAWTHAALIPGIDYTPISIPAPPPPPTPVAREDDMTLLVRCNDGDNAIFLTDGIIKTWVRDGDAYAELRDLGIAKAGLDGEPLALSRAAISSFALVGVAPAYEPDFTGPRTTA